MESQPNAISPPPSPSILLSMQRSSCWITDVNFSKAAAFSRNRHTESQCAPTKAKCLSVMKWWVQPARTRVQHFSTQYRSIDTSCGCFMSRRHFCQCVTPLLLPTWIVYLRKTTQTTKCNYLGDNGNKNRDLPLCRLHSTRLPVALTGKHLNKVMNLKPVFFRVTDNVDMCCALGRPLTHIIPPNLSWEEVKEDYWGEGHSEANNRGTGNFVTVLLFMLPLYGTAFWLFYFNLIIPWFY